MASPIVRRVVGILSALLVSAVALTGLAGPAHAEDGYRYWHYLHLDGADWAFAETGPADVVPEDGDVEGFRFGTSTMSQPIAPRTDSDEVTFDTVCDGVEAAEDEKRVAVVLDFGTEEDAGAPPENRADCAVVASDATTQQVIGTVADLRVEGGLTCAFDGYPTTGCGVPVTDAQVPAEEEPVTFTLTSAADAGADDEGAEGTTGAGQAEDPDEWKGIAAILLVFALVGASALLMRRRAKAS